MYRPAYSRSDDPALARAVIKAHPFGTLVSVVEGLPYATPLPFLLDGDSILGHLARANPHARHLDQEVLVTFQGPHAFVSPRWYAEPDQHVPTWNYVAVHVIAKPERVEAGEVVRRLSAEFDPDWLPGPIVTELLPAIVAFRIPLARVELKLKLSQNRDPDDARRVEEALAKGSLEDQAVARWMTDLRSNRPSC